MHDDEPYLCARFHPGAGVDICMMMNPISVQDFTLEPAGQSSQREKNKATG
jgi:CO dehydrogenase/acetyl-CoA synthase delta subunit